MIAMLKQPGTAPVRIDIEAGTENLCRVLGGEMEHVGFGMGIGVLCDEEGRYKGPVINGKPTSLPYNFRLDSYISFVGTVLFVGEGKEDFIDLTEEQIEIISDFFKKKRRHLK